MPLQYQCPLPGAERHNFCGQVATGWSGGPSHTRRRSGAGVLPHTSGAAMGVNAGAGKLVQARKTRAKNRAALLDENSAVPALKEQRG